MNPPSVEAAVQEDEATYLAQTTPPPRFLAVLNGAAVPCLACKWAMEVDLVLLASTLETIRRWVGCSDREAQERARPPARLFRLALRCRNGHVETWCAVTPERLASGQPVKRRQRGRRTLGSQQNLAQRMRAMMVTTDVDRQAGRRLWLNEGPAPWTMTQRKVPVGHENGRG